MDGWGERVRSLFGRLGRHEVRLFLPLLLAAGGIWTFIELAEAMGEGETHAVDEAILLALRTSGDLADPIGPRWLDLTARDFTALGGIPVLVTLTLAAACYLLLVRKWGAALLVTLSTAGGILANGLLKDHFGRPRPDLVPHGVEVVTASFPSGHAMLSAVVYLTLGALLARVQPNRKLKAFILLTALMLTLLIGASRVYLGVHWPSDVAAGWAVGTAWATLCWGLAYLRRRETPSVDDGTAPSAEGGNQNG